MKNQTFLAALACTVWLSGCAIHNSNPTPSLASHIGERVVLDGIAEQRKLGPALRGDGFDVWIDRLGEWPAALAGHRVRVTGILEERHDLPVFVPKPGEPIVAGMAVAEGTDLNEASRRYVIRDAKWTLVR